MRDGWTGTVYKLRRWASILLDLFGLDFYLHFLPSQSCIFLSPFLTSDVLMRVYEMSSISYNSTLLYISIITIIKHNLVNPGQSNRTD